MFTWLPKEDPLGSLMPRVANIVVGVIDFYHKFVSLDNKATMSSLEEVRMVQANKEDEEVEQVGGIIPNLGCTRTKILNTTGCRNSIGMTRKWNRWVASFPTLVSPEPKILNSTPEPKIINSTGRRKSIGTPTLPW